MNLHGVVGPVIAAINPMIIATLQKSAGYTTSADGDRVPVYTTTTAQIQVQALQYNDIAQLDALNIQGERRKLYLNGYWDGLVRADQKGGDLITFPEYVGGPSRTWLVAMVLEHWPDFTVVAVTLQDPGAPDAGS